MSLFEWQKLVVVMYTPDNTEVQIGSFPCESSERVGPLKSAEEDGVIFFLFLSVMTIGNHNL